MNLFGKVTGDAKVFKEANSGVKIIIEKAEKSIANCFQMVA